MTAFFAGFLLFTPSEAGRLIQRYGYYGIALTTAWWLWSVARSFRGSGKWDCVLQARGVWRAVVLVLGLAAVALMIFPYGCKILYDEYVLQATAFHMHLTREVGALVRAYEIEGVFRPFDVYLDKRPYFFPFILSLVHDFTGFRAANAFVVNSMLFPVVLALFYAVSRGLGGRDGGMVALASFGASPLLAFNANGAGMELLNLAMILVCVICSAAYLRAPDGRRLSVLLLSCVLLAQSRYESLLYVVPTALVVLEGWRRAGKVLLPPAALAAPLLLIPSALHFSYLSGTPALWELREDVSSRFSWQHVGWNLKHGFAFFFDFTRTTFGSWWLAIPGFAALVLMLTMAARRVRTWTSAPPFVAATIVFGGAATANLMLLTAYFWGQLTDPMVSRLALPFSMFLGFAIAAAIGVWKPSLPVVRGWIAVVLLAYLSFGLSAATYQRDLSELVSEIEWERRVVQEQMPPAARLIITNKSALPWLIQHVPAIGIGRARERPDELRLHLEWGTFDEVLVAQAYRPTSATGDHQIDPSQDLTGLFVLETVAERHFGGHIARISRVVKITPEVAPRTAWAGSVP